MAFLLKKQIASDSAPLYTVGLQNTILVVGLGNPGKEYETTRHNAGFMVLDTLAEQNNVGWVTKKDLQAQLAQTSVANHRVILAKPQTFMNDSGKAVQAVQHFYKVPASGVVVVHDELDMPFGQIRTRVGGGSAGHNGLKSVIQHLGEEFGRVRIGVSNNHAEQSDSADFVLAPFNKEEKAVLPHMTREAVAIITEYLASGELPHDTRSFIS